MIKAEIISIGSELTSGRNLDTNSAWLSRELAEHGIEVGWHTTIADDRAANRDCFALATQRAGLVISTGGLGPTLDDLTREVLAELAGVSLEYHEPSWQHFQEPRPANSRTQPCSGYVSPRLGSAFQCPWHRARNLDARGQRHCRGSTRAAP